MTIRSDAFRVNEDSKNDVGVKGLRARLKTIYDTYPESDVIVEVRTDLDSHYGSSNVTEAISTGGTRWVWNPVTKEWELVDKAGSVFTINDGQTNPMVAEVYILTPA